ncbi:uncharacterized protein BYT42DRAFT_645861 [Radiomyces spectabilis]|uniref:uncharacterized protein n=1 Tax=Radiomyces spectabilis TaxID=64574 RepID=UPI00221F96EE|nr:uncharacterized protein BYT42DRAFT_645861 [Radiomyces spectabilis]KAI8376221.1 hypothetical protein BYT42DRAFT_645861 [Radiomyces spectabilis]
MSSTNTYAQEDGVSALHTPQEQLWKIIREQRVMIQTLEKDNARLTAQRDGLVDRVHCLERDLARTQRAASILITPEAMREIAEAEEATTPVESSSPLDPLNISFSPLSPMPPPRSPYRSCKEAGKPHELSHDGHEPAPFNKNSVSPSTARSRSAGWEPSAGGDDEERSPPGTPAPGPHTPTSLRMTIMEKDAQQYAKYQSSTAMKSVKSKPSPASSLPAPIPPPHGSHLQQSNQRGTMMPIPPIPSKSTSLDIRRSPRARDSMMPPARAILDHDPSVRAASPPLSRSATYVPYVVPSENALSLNVPMSAATTQRSKRESKMFTGRLDFSAMGPSVPDIDEDGDAPIQSEEPHGMFSPFDNFANISIKVLGSNIRTNDRGKEVISFVISVGKKSNAHEKEGSDADFEELWRVEKLYSDILGLDTKLKAQRNRAVTSRIGKLPDKALFATNAPSKVDQRKMALEQYLRHVVMLPLDDISDLCEFLSTNVVGPEYRRPAGRKEGYLTKRGKNFGGWKTRYFVLNGPVLEYYDSKGGNLLSTIRLTNAQIGRQTSANNVQALDDSFTSVYRHAFLIMEQKRTGSSHVVRHILCADSDEDRDEWIEALFLNIRFDDTLDATQPKRDDRNIPPTIAKRNKKPEKPRKLSKGEIRTVSAAPIKDMKLDTGADLQKLISVPTIHMAPSPSTESMPEGVGIAITGLTPSFSNESCESLSLSSSVPSNTSTAWSADQATSPQFVSTGRTSFDQSSVRGLQTPKPTMVRRSSMVNLLHHAEEENGSRSGATSPSHGRESDESLEVPADVTEKKTKNKSNRMTFWGKKMFSSSSNSNSVGGNNNANETMPVPANPRPSTSTSATTFSEASRPSTTTSSGFRSFLSRTSCESSNDRQSQKKSMSEEPMPNKQVFGVPLEEAVRVSGVSERYPLPAIVLRCIEYLDAKDAVLEEGLYRLSGSNTMMKSLKEKFNQDGDFNLLASKEEYDVHAIAGLLKMWLRELPTSVLTRERRMDFLHVIDLLDRKERVNELGRLVSSLPLANYTLLRALTAHLIRVVQHADVNKMTIRNVSIVFSPTLGIPATIFNLFMSEFEYIFWTTEEGDAAPRLLEESEKEEEKQEEAVAVAAASEDEGGSGAATATKVENGFKPLGRKPTLKLREEHGRSNRNSVNYMDGAPVAIVDLEKHMDGPPVLDEEVDEVDDLTLTVGLEEEADLLINETSKQGGPSEA